VVLDVPLPGRFNVLNALGAAAVARGLGLDLDEIAAALPGATLAPGRFEPVRAGQDFAVLIDYAHTPDSLEHALVAARQVASGRVHCVFGCGGDRDRGKRPLMGEVATRLADRVIVTSDNPRSEDPEAIIAEIVAGATGGRTEPEVVADRREAIREAVVGARSGDVVLVAGKGHEQGQEVAGRILPFDDAAVARDALSGAPAR
jgi:UDP-N-acetylmuramoyl-L-alanyl-D-glutamate--2,6-diaminopimelate ligase